MLKGLLKTIDNADMAMYKFAKGIEVNDNTLCTDLINEMEFCEKGTYLDREHTAMNFREVLWDSKCFDRGYRKEGNLTALQADEKILKRADHDWKDIVAKQDAPEITTDFADELDRIVDAACKELRKARPGCNDF